MRNVAHRSNIVKACTCAMERPDVSSTTLKCRLVQQMWHHLITVNCNQRYMSAVQQKPKLPREPWNYWQLTHAQAQTPFWEQASPETSGVPTLSCFASCTMWSPVQARPEWGKPYDNYTNEYIREKARWLGTHVHAVTIVPFNLIQFDSPKHEKTWLQSTSLHNILL